MEQNGNRAIGTGRWQILAILVAAFIFACSASALPDPWEEYKALELSRLEEYGEPLSFYSVYEGKLGPAPLRMVTWILGRTHFRVDSDMGITSVAMGYDGESGWMQIKGAPPRKLSPAEEEELFTGKYFDSVEYLTDPELEVQRIGEENWDGEKVIEYALTSPDGYKRDVFLRVGDFELVGYRSYGTATALIKLYDVKREGYFAVPGRVTMEVPGLGMDIVFALVEAEVNVEIDPSVFLPPKGSLSPLALKDGAARVAIPLIESASGMFLVNGKVGEVEGVFLFDTGAATGVLDSTAAEGLEITAETGFTAVGVGGAEGSRIIRTSSRITLGGDGEVVLPEEISYMTLDLGTLSDEFGSVLIGIIGPDLLARARVEVDPDAKILYIIPYTDRESGGEAGEAEYPIELIGQLAIIEGRTEDGQTIKLLLDTGFNGEIGLLSAGVRRLGLEVKKTGRGDVITGVGGISRFKGRVEDLSLSVLGMEFNLEQVPVISGPLDSLLGGSVDGILGMGALGGVSLEFDYSSGVIRVK